MYFCSCSICNYMASFYSHKNDFSETLKKNNLDKGREGKNYPEALIAQVIIVNILLKFFCPCLLLNVLLEKALYFCVFPLQNPTSESNHEKNIRKILVKECSTKGLMTMPESCQGHQ